MGRKQIEPVVRFAGDTESGSGGCQALRESGVCDGGSRAAAIRVFKAPGDREIGAINDLG